MSKGHRDEQGGDGGVAGNQLKLDSQQAGESAFRVWRSVMAHEAGSPGGWVGEPPGLELMPEPCRRGWARLGQQAEGVLAQMVGASYQEAACRVMALYLDSSERPHAAAAWGALSETAKLAWEAVARHLTMLLNCDELTSLEEAEAVWPEWARARAFSNGVLGRG